MSEASPICRGKNLTLETVLAFVNAMPLTPMKKAEFHAVTESKLKGWTQTHSQIARQLALYFEKEGICYPRFSQRMTYTDILCYMVNWAKHYFVPNIYTPSLKIEGYRITNIYAYLKNCVKNGVCSYNDACLQMFGVELNNTDKVRVYINNFTDLIISDDLMFVNDHLADTSIPEIYPKNIGLSAEDYFNYFTIGLHQKADSLQQIFYGAPGTGKSHAINELTAGKDVIRTTFHPDTDYSTFVGAYKPTTKSVPVTTVIGTNAVPVKLNGKEMMEDKIVYEYVSQAFLQAYVAAWRKYCDVQEGEEPVDEFLVIEEINRGNCAQIFGDLFQLLDRGDEEFSEYPIKADSDMKKLLEHEFKGLEIKNKEGINALFKGGKDIVAEVLAGDVLLLPNNLYIWATMNTSDQSLFPIDSAFKRRWDWHYVPISDAGKKWMIEVNGAQYDWWKFLEAINDKVYHATYSEDKKMGYFFCKANDGVISADKFVSKVIFYLWNDVFKDSEFEGDTFKDEDGEKLSFDKFYSVENNQVKVNEKKIVKFLSNLNLEPDSEADEDNSEEGFETEGDKKLPKTPKVFTVEFPDGTVINEKNRFETYLKVLSKIGIEQVEKIAEEMKYQRRNTPLVTKIQHEEILNDAVYSYVQEGDYYIVKGIDAITMYNMVMLLDNRLDLQLKVCYE
mgnify:CR=1 FL=1